MFGDGTRFQISFAGVVIDSGVDRTVLAFTPDFSFVAEVTRDETELVLFEYSLDTYFRVEQIPVCRSGVVLVSPIGEAKSDFVFALYNVEFDVPRWCCVFYFCNFFAEGLEILFVGDIEPFVRAIVVRPEEVVVLEIRDRSLDCGLELFCDTVGFVREITSGRIEFGRYRNGSTSEE